jgi:uncharacterized protein (TIGR03435 family)
MKIAVHALLGFGLLSVPLAFAQQSTASSAGSEAVPAPCVAGARATFDVSTVKASQTSSHSSSMRSMADSLTATGALRLMIMNAYGLRDFQITGGPDWVNTATWEVAAKIDPPDKAPPKADPAYDAFNARRSQRLQSLLADRFGLKCHMVTKELPVYELVLAKGGSKLKETTAEEGKRGSTNIHGQDHKSTGTFTGITTKALAATLSGETGRTVVDKTGLTASYDFTLTWASDDQPTAADADTASGPTIFTALQEQLGLKLESSKGPVEVLVIDSVEKPGEN